MQIVQSLAGYSLGRSDMVRRAMSKKKADVMAKEREYFINGIDDVPGCVANGIPENIANKTFDEMISFAEYAFNKSHAAAYAVVAFQTAWLKTHYPVEFMAALMTSVLGNPTKLAGYIVNCRQMGIKIMPPDINEGFSGFSTSSEGNILYGLSAVKGVGIQIIENMTAERQKNGVFTSLTDFIERMGSNVNSKTIENLILAGAFDSLGGKRAQYMQVYSSIYDGFKNNRRKNIEGQMDLFGMASNSEGVGPKDKLPNIDEFDHKYKLSKEKEILGLYVSGNPLDKYWDTIKKYISATTADFPGDDKEGSIQDKDAVKTAGIISSVTTKFTKNNKLMAFITLEDMFGSIEVIVFPDVYGKYSAYIKEDNIILLTGKATISEDQPSKIICESITPYDKIENADKTLWIKLPAGSDLKTQDIIEALRSHKGGSKAVIYVEATKERLYAGADNYVKIDDMLVQKLEKMLGDGCVVVK